MIVPGPQTLLLHSCLCHHKSSEVNLFLCEWNVIYRQLCKKQAVVMAERALSSARANDRLWQRNGRRAFHHNPYSTRIDPHAYFHTVMDGIVPPSPLLVQIITNQYALKAPHQNIILTHDLFPPMLHSPSHVQGSRWRGVLCPTPLPPVRSIKAIS